MYSIFALSSFSPQIQSGDSRCNSEGCTAHHCCSNVNDEPPRLQRRHELCCFCVKDRDSKTEGEQGRRCDKESEPTQVSTKGPHQVDAQQRNAGGQRVFVHVAPGHAACPDCPQHSAHQEEGKSQPGKRHTHIASTPTSIILRIGLRLRGRGLRGTPHTDRNAFVRSRG